MSDIKSMKLYNNVERVYNELAELGKSDSEPLTVEEITPFDQLHYHGTDALDIAIKQLGIKAGDSVLEIGSGIGGPARYLAKHTGALITALELQEDQNNVAAELSRRCGLTKNLNHVCGDVLEFDFGEMNFDHIVSWLALYHIPDRARLLEKCATLLNSGGQFFTEDLYARKAFSEDELKELSLELFANTIVSENVYVQQLEDFGLTVERMEEMSDDWSEFTRQRFDDFIEQKDRHIRVHGESTFESLQQFYSVVNRYFNSGKLGGIRLSASRK